MPDSSSAWGFPSNQSRINPPSPEVKREDTMTNDPWSISCPELFEGAQVSVLPPKPSPQTSPPVELEHPRKASLFSMLLESKYEGPLVMKLADSDMDVPVDRKTGMGEAQKRRQRNAEASARSRKKRVLKEAQVRKETEEARREIQEKDKILKEKDEEIEFWRRKSAKKLEDEELENKRLTTLLEDEAVPEEMTQMSYAPDATLLGATYDPIFNPFLTPDYYLAGDNYAADPTELYLDCIQSLYAQHE
ncbi:uncharacterized protein CPUR_01592 [Claviceps purpurea 20.1]|uniref:BZIP domain-containing protein n=1 Tax=Claviceps purpurea (strain 20.1) TaxID=1111077 RepID=M1W6Y6_CLAP2|nr:uncharacterized protein CPUR_01592 [Claviceps purpurea 20.1]